MSEIVTTNAPITTVTTSTTQTLVNTAIVETLVTLSANTGPQGVPGVNMFYTFNQANPATIWNITHNLGGHPTAVVLDSTGTQCEGSFSYPDINNLTISFRSAFSGTAYLI